MLCDPEANQLVQRVSGGGCAHEFVEVLGHIKIERRTRQAQDSAGYVLALAIIEMTYEAESAELGRYDIGGRDAWDISTFPDMGYEARPSMEIQFRPIKT